MDEAHTNKIDITNADEVSYWTAALHVSRPQLEEAVQAAGPSAEAVKIYLKQTYPAAHVMPPSA
jgi:hypothetical protein